MSNGPAIVIEGTREDWPGGPRTLTPLDPAREPNRQTFWFGAELAPGRQPGVVPDHPGGHPPDAGGGARLDSTGSRGYPAASSTHTIPGRPN